MCLDDPTHSRRDILKLAALLSAAGALPLLSSLQARAAAEPDAPVRIGYLPITDATPLLVAHANGLFEAEGIQAERPVLLRSWAQVIEAFISGQVNVIHLLSPMTVWARYGSKVPAKVVAWNHVGGSGLTVAPEIADVRQLGGKSVAIPFWYSIHNVVLQQLLRDNGLFEAEGIQAERPVLLRSWAQVIEAFISGQVNVIHLLSPMTVWARYGSKVPAKVVAWNHVGGSGLTVAPEIADVRQL
ncbi:ABC transporter substrate-binding protein, partial [Pseudomonas aeruginosa]|uniref:ABC transporter substrate-binding protein n=1 Tax=Pseudomonas aeruginosa TaxID=287 RepID=UPI001F1E31F8